LTDITDTIKRERHGYEATRGAAMAALAKSWRGEERAALPCPARLSPYLQK
jgi:hypothetical protein